ncbi:hypothetical protein VHUM_02673 [Vanrija humicola]|uniref:Prefoldin subunit 5 n=1 Tax=Vanrija humicola TaxID=5417 RepID=A0A7D8YZ98_VANHU|nr:hypothetical protein VHUM_02673 [Vanrija humicola]
MSSSAYSAHLQRTVVPQLAAVREAIAAVDGDIADYEQVARRLARADPARSHRTPAEIGAGVWVDTQVHDASVITLDLGLDVHLTLPVDEAAAYATKRADVLRKKRAALASREERLNWEVQQFEGAIKEADAREAAAAAAAPSS